MWLNGAKYGQLLLITNRKSHTGFQMDRALATSYRLSIVGLTMSPYSGSAAIFNGKFQAIKWSYLRNGER